MTLTENLPVVTRADHYARTTYSAVLKHLMDPYEGQEWAEEVRTLEPDFTQAVLVSSANGFAQHLPALDIDGGVALAMTDTGYDLWVDTSCSSFQFRRLLSELSRAGLVPYNIKGLSYLSRDARRARYYESAFDAVIDTRLLTKIIVQEHESFKGSYEELLRSALTTAQGARHAQGPTMQNPRRIPLLVPAILVDSTHNHHLYLEKALTWDQYQLVLKAFSRAGIVEKGFSYLAGMRGASFLRLPWIKKD